MRAIVTPRRLALVVALTVATAILASCVPDTTPPSVPKGLTATAASSSQIDLRWTPSTDDVGVTGYKVFRNGSQVATSTTPSYRDTGLLSATIYTYAVSAHDAAGNNSARSATASAKTAPISTTPKLFMGDECWGLLINAGRWNGGNWRATIDSYLSARQAQGFNAVEVSAFSWLGPENPSPFAHTTGQDWDGLYPFTSTMNPSSGLNSNFWSRRDYLINQAALRGITVVMNVTSPGLNFDTTPVSPLRGWTTQQWESYGTALGNRYKNTVGLRWILGDDYYSTLDAGFDTWLSALRSTGDQHLVSVQNFGNSTSRTQIYPLPGGSLAWGTAHAQYDWVYTYNASYDGIEKAYLHDGNIPVYYGDGFGLNGTDVRIIRKMIWWALSSGARGVNTIDEKLWRFPANWHDLMTGNATPEATYWSAVIPAIGSAFQRLTNWNLLRPDTSSQLVTSGRGTHTTGQEQYYSYQDTDNYVTASRTPNGNLAVIFLSKAHTITVDTSKLLAGYVARWMDPLTGTQYAATPTSTQGSIATYNSGGVQGGKGVNNSAGDGDWVLVFRR